jgi:hypothetical protein
MSTRESGQHQHHDIHGHQNHGHEIHAHHDRPLNLRETALLACAFLSLGLSLASFLTI